MLEYSEQIAGVLLGMEQDFAQEFEARLAESATLAFRVAFSVLRNSEDSEDVAQEAFARAYSHFHQLRDRDRFRQWLVRMTWRMAISRLRTIKRRCLRESNPTEPSVVSSPVQIILERERSDRLWRAIDGLPEKLRLVIVLSSIEEHDTREVARLLSLPEGTVKSRLFLARQRLREGLK